MSRVTRSKTKVDRPRKDVYTEKLEDDTVGAIPETKKRRVKNSTANKMIHQLTKQKLESLKPSYKLPNTHRQTSPKNTKTAIDKINNINSVFSTSSPSLRNFDPEIYNQMELLNKYKIFKNMNIDIRTIDILQNSTLGEMDAQDREFLQTIKGKSEEEQIDGLYELYGIKKN